MTIELKPSQEEAIQEAIKAGAFRSVDEFLERAIAILSIAAVPAAAPRQSRLRELREGLRLGDLSIKDLIGEGRE